MIRYDIIASYNNPNRVAYEILINADVVNLTHYYGPIWNFWEPLP